MSYTNGLDNPELYFQTKLYSGTGSTNSVTFDGSENMQPDWVWIKARSNSDQPHALFDSVRGVNKVLYSNNTDAEDDDSSNGSLTSFNSDGFTVGGYYNRVNQSGQTFASWNWKASGSTASNTDGSITSTVSANQTAGFSIVSYTGNGSSSATVGHGLNVVPKVVICKKRTGSGASNWHMRHEDLTSNHNLWIDATDAEYDMTNEVNNGGLANLSSSSTFGFLSGVQNADAVNESSGTFIAYCFAEKKGYSKFGSYTGNGNADGSYIHLGFKPAWVITKRTDTTSDWYLSDNKRNGFNDDNHVIYANESDAEKTVNRIDILSNGFKLRSTGAGVNASGGTYIYMAFAENPFVTSSGVPACAR